MINDIEYGYGRRYLYDVPLSLQSPETSIETLKAAHKYQCAGLVRKCVNHLIGLISTENVLLITANVGILCGDFQNLEVKINNISYISLFNISGNWKY